MTDFDTFWTAFPGDLCNRKGSKSEAKKLWDKIDSKEYDKILINMRELMRADRKVKKMGGGKPEWVWPMVSTWLRQRRFDDDMEDLTQSADMEQYERKCQCGNPIAVVNQCNDCYDKTHELPFIAELREACRRNAIKPEPGQSVADAHRQWWHKKGRMGGIVTTR